MSSIHIIKNALGASNPTRYLRSTIWLTLAKVASMAVSLLATFYVARTLGPQNFGELSYAQSVVSIFAIFGGLTGVLYRDIISKKEQEGVYLGTAWIISLCNSFITAALVGTYAFFLPHDSLTLYVIGIILISQFFSPFYIIANIFYAKTETKWLSIYQFLIHIVISGCKVAAMIFGQGVLILAVIIVLEHIITAFVLSLLYLYLHKGSFLNWVFNFPYAKRMMLDSFPIVIIAASGMISARIDQVFLKHFFDTATVGLYGVAVQLSEVWQFIPGIILSAIFPAIVNARQNKTTYRRRISLLFFTFLIFGIVISLITTFFAPLIINLIYGAAFSGSVIILKIYIWSLTGIILGFLINYFLLNENLRKIQIITGLIPMIINVILNIILIPKYGAVGAALATAISYSLLPFIPFFFSAVRRALF